MVLLYTCSEETMDSLDLALVSAMMEKSKKEEGGKDEVHKLPSLLFSSVSSGEEEENMELVKLKESRECVTEDDTQTMDQETCREDVHQPLLSSSHHLKSSVPARPDWNRSTTATETDRVRDTLPVIGRVRPDDEVLNMELVTKLARATSAKVFLHNLMVDTHAVDKLISNHNAASKHAKNRRKKVATAGCATCIE